MACAKADANGWIPATDKQVVGSSLVGKIYAEYRYVCDALGYPHIVHPSVVDQLRGLSFHPDEFDRVVRVRRRDDKSRVEWCFVCPDGGIATLYDYKDQSDFLRDSYLWHVGGNSLMAVLFMLERIIDSRLFSFVRPLGR